ncbi:MAG: pseudouridine synthase [Nitrosomonas sp.]|nr:pseudouridine synthase [Nitrosomonas sp.]MCW5608116.1 pseudouridine synthase [Nitrosomonas sp.]
MSRLILFNKPYGVICQFSAVSEHVSLKQYIPLPGFYPAGRLDTDSEGLVLLTDDGCLQHRISNPEFKLPKLYWVQIEGIPTSEALQQLREGVVIRNYVTQPAGVTLIEQPANLWPRMPPVRTRKYIPTVWVELILKEGKNRQVRRMTAAVGYPTLRLIRFAVGRYTLKDLAPGDWHLLNVSR